MVTSQLIGSGIWSPGDGVAGTGPIGSDKSASGSWCDLTNRPPTSDGRQRTRQVRGLLRPVRVDGDDTRPQPAGQGTGRAANRVAAGQAGQGDAAAINRFDVSGQRVPPSPISCVVEHRIHGEPADPAGQVSLFRGLRRRPITCGATEPTPRFGRTRKSKNSLHLGKRCPPTLSPMRTTLGTTRPARKPASSSLPRVYKE
jgi:hypothetical protein